MASGSTIVGIATAPVPAGVGVLRLSGALARDIAQALAPGVPQPPVARHAYFTPFTDRAGQVLDEGLFLFFQGPQSFTGEDVVELQAHGSPRLLALLLAELLKDDRLRLAEPGEFTRRAFVNGRIDLARAEAVADLVAADSEAAVRAAAAQVRGGLSAALAPIREQLSSLRADVEAALTFPEEAEDADRELGERLEPIHRSLAELVRSCRSGRLARRGARVVLLGPVNAGKSTLFNRLLGEARALVDAEPGTTRDVLEARVELEGLAVSLMDTAGLRTAPGRLEALGIERAREALRSADLAIVVVPPGSGPADVEVWRAEAQGVPTLVIQGKADLLAPSEAGSGPRVSGLTGAGVEDLRRAILERLWERGDPKAIQVTSERHTILLGRALECVERAVAAERASTTEVVAGELGLAAEALGQITGEDVSEALLDEIFRRFCIGK